MRCCERRGISWRRSPIWWCSSISESSICGWHRRCADLVTRSRFWIVFPPGTWLDNAEKARRVAALTEPVTAFEHQYNFYRSLGARISISDIRLRAGIAMRPLRAAAPKRGGVVALLPGSRAGEVRRHMPVLAAAYRELQRRRPKLRGVAGAADERAERMIRQRARARRVARALQSCAASKPAVADADAAWVSSGTAVLETALLGVPTVGIYVIPRIFIWYGHRMIRHDFIMLPNLVLGSAKSCPSCCKNGQRRRSSPTPQKP